MRTSSPLVLLLLVVVLLLVGIDEVAPNSKAGNNNRNAKNAKGGGGSKQGQYNATSGKGNQKGKKKDPGGGGTPKGQSKGPEQGKQKKKREDSHFDEFIKDTENKQDEDNFMDELNKFEKNFHDEDFENTENLFDNYGKGEGHDGEYNNIDKSNNENYNRMKPDANDYQYIDNDDVVEGDEDLTNIWNKNMQNFEPSTLLTFEIQGNSEEYLFEEVNNLNTYFRGVFYSNNESDDNKILFLIADPDGEIIYKKEASEGIFYFYTQKIGVYTITLKNSKWVGKKLTTVALGLGESPSLKSEHIKDFTNYIDKIVAETKRLKNELKYLSSKHMAHIEKMRKITNKAFLYCFIKLFVLIFLSLFTIYYIKNLVSNKRVL
ncbi:transmembrane emp24 domain-containing protein, putative [Plasmodium knowlesi strain H]|uniref:Transmembrane emp24 domain-containing protein, putative n=3 Tax=Plasmodium knowlesi TaxID=5850 RepID=A0A5K1UA71_PLAKH|nr:transmembrane emp24 domain-containing protein, putative [Plasmodium knowlesi strain H]OTN68081.1 putative Transmembrane emp24 domain-containing protein [Plasmodium knowlesi]CAA9987025.1 transmembrane emp24 domain-containing protein, putative [Plasmodium knowlesi strain H]SBO26697.1 transmembrane emp24 domain-containing protein, putative [Plasmodium knowlesi strain H]SBO28230.1 transmembrane emp24 domain-containing protein, putative [Plasmodium knowlesi strain H]VVS76499.1 transmembrane emp2|eukprot:XP_002258270.1 hypothetical protein, conserved in Plasmodium species [Plasmodium knowlesi strain H]